MKIKRPSNRTMMKWAVWSVLGLLLVVFLIRVIVFENNYYNEKEGSERDVAELVDDSDEELIEEVPTDEEVREYTVAPERPRYLSIPRLGVTNARIFPMGVNSKGELDTPRNIFDVGWYESSGLPGKGGTMVIDGHNGGPHVHGVFKDLPILVKGDLIQVERGDGVIFKYQVVENNTILLSEADQYMYTATKSPEAGKEAITLITCTGEWSQQQGTYLSRQFTRAVLAE